MTLDEARLVLRVERGATHATVREAFRRRARDLHPDRHPHADADEKRRLAAEFARAREAHDILLLVAPGSSEPPSANASHPDAEPTRGASPRPSPRTSTRASSGSRADRGASSQASGATRTTTAPPPRHTLRFEEFVKQTDAAGFGPGTRTRRHIDVARIVAWSVVGAAAAAVGVGAYLASVSV